MLVYVGGGGGGGGGVLNNSILCRYHIPSFSVVL